MLFSSFDLLDLDYIYNIYMCININMGNVIKFICIIIYTILDFVLYFFFTIIDRIFDSIIKFINIIDVIGIHIDYLDPEHPLELDKPQPSPYPKPLENGREGISLYDVDSDDEIYLEPDSTPYAPPADVDPSEK